MTTSATCRPDSRYASAAAMSRIWNVVSMTGPNSKRLERAVHPLVHLYRAKSEASYKQVVRHYGPRVEKPGRSHQCTITLIVPPTALALLD
jgi:hypothetical protein